MNESYSKIVVKFGGSSLADAGQFKKVAEIIKSNDARKYVIPSAPGRRFKEDGKVTDMLINCQTRSAHGEEYLTLLAEIEKRYNDIIEGLGLSISLEPEFNIIEAKLKYGCSRDYLASRGEYLNGIILAAYLGFEFIDAAKVIFFDFDGKFDSEATNAVMKRRLNSSEYAVIPGFYGSMPDGSIKTFTRGGSDITGAIVARASESDMYENWTDVSGFLMCDPRIVSNPKAIDVVTYRELRELSYMGATVLHEDAIFPVKIASIPINIKNTNSPEDSGTFIVPEKASMRSTNVITGIAGKKNFSIFHIEKDMMNSELGVGMRVLKVFNDMMIPFEHLPSGIDTMSVVISDNYVAGRENEIIAKIKEIVNPDIITIERSLALVAIVGRGMINAHGTASRVFTAIANAGVNIKMIDQGSSELNIIIGIDNADFDKTINAIYKEFVH